MVLRSTIWRFRFGLINSYLRFSPRLANLMFGISDSHHWRCSGLHLTLAGKSFPSGEFLLQRVVAFQVAIALLVGCFGWVVSSDGRGSCCSVNALANSGDDLVVGLVTGSNTTSFHTDCCSSISARLSALALADLFISVFRDVFVVPVFIKSSSHAALLVGLSLVDIIMMFGGSLCGWFFLNVWTMVRGISWFLWLIICQGLVLPFVRSFRWCECLFGVCLFVLCVRLATALAECGFIFVFLVVFLRVFG